VLLDSFHEKADSLRQCSADVKTLIREGYDKKIAKETAKRMFGDDGQEVSFLAIDGTQSQDQELDMLVFYAGAFGYIGKMDFSGDNGCGYEEPSQAEGTTSISAAIPVHEEDTADVAGEKTEGGVEVDTNRVPTGLMHLAEYYLAVKTLRERPNIKVVLVDRMLAGDVAHIVGSAIELLDSERGCIIEGMDTPHGKVTALDLELARMLHPNDALQFPAPRSQLIQYASLHRLMQQADKAMTLEEILANTEAKKERIDKISKELAKFEKHYSLLVQDNNYHDRQNLHQQQANSRYQLKSGVEHYWDRVLDASLKISDHIFNTPEGKHPLLHDKEGDGNKKNTSWWITAADLEYLTLIMLYALLREAWKRNVLLIGLIKDFAAAEMIRTVVPILHNAGKIKLVRELPRFNSDKMLLQTSSVINGAETKAPWRTFEFDACFRTIAPVEDKTLPKGHARVRGAFKNLISAERMFVKSYIQLWCSDTDPSVRSHVFSYDRPCYPGFDDVVANDDDNNNNNLILHHEDGKVDEEIRPMIYFEHDSDISHLVMDILCSMSLEVIPECLGHNYPLFLADKKAKSSLQGTRSAYLSTVSFEMAKHQLDQQVLFEAKFREFRSSIENARRKG
jgi:hypothetical protein